jgi:hypothetical protein
MKSTDKKNLPSNIKTYILLLIIGALAYNIFLFIDEYIIIKKVEDVAYKIELQDCITNCNRYNFPINDLQDFFSCISKNSSLKDLFSNSNICVSINNDSIILYARISNQILLWLINQEKIIGKNLVLIAKHANYVNDEFFINKKHIQDSLVKVEVLKELKELENEQNSLSLRGYYIYNTRILLSLTLDTINNYYKYDILLQTKKPPSQIDYSTEQYIISLIETIDKTLNSYKITYCQFYVTIPIKAPFPPPNS